MGKHRKPLDTGIDQNLSPNCQSGSTQAKWTLSHINWDLVVKGPVKSSKVR